MNKEFIPYEQALELKELGFNEPCFGFYIASQLVMTSDNVYNSSDIPVYKAPLYQQAFRWFREKYGLYSTIIFRVSMEDNNEYWDWLIKGEEVVYRHFNTYEEAEDACLIKLIEMLERKPEAYS